MKKILLIITLFLTQISFAQKLVSTKSTTKFFSSATLEDIAATTNKGKSVLDSSNGNIAFSIPINTFEFAKSLMQEHFNEKYMESEKFPKATFSGVIEGWENGISNSEAEAKGKLTIHGVTKTISAPGSVEYSKNKLTVTAKFNIRLEDYGVEVPSLMWQKIAEVVEVTIHYEYNSNDK